MEEIKHPRTEKDIIHDALIEATTFYKDERTPSDNSLAALEEKLYNDLFGHRDLGVLKPD